MSNIYNQQLKDALGKVKDASQQNELTENNTLQAAKLGLYHAHGLTSKSSNLLSEALEKMGDDAQQNQVASIAATASQNIVTVSNAAVVDASNTTSTASTTAASIEKAATALTNLYGSVAQTLAVANSLDNGTKIQRLVKKADDATKEAAKLAEEASILAMNMTIDASQSRAANVVTQAGVVKGNITSLVKSLASSFTKQQELVGNDLGTMTSAVAAESVQAGVYKTALAEDDALLSSMGFLNECVNNNLSCAIEGLQDGVVTAAGCAGDQFTLSFSAFTETEDDQPIIKEYRLIIVKEDDLAAFNIETAKATEKKGYVPVEPSSIEVYSQKFITADFLNDNAESPKNAIARDYHGAPVTRGIPYTFFVYVVYTKEYQESANDTKGLLSLPAPSFTLLRYLPAVQTSNMSLAFYQTKDSDAMRVAFKVPVSQMQVNKETNLNELMEFRTFLFHDKDRQSLELNQQIDALEQTLFTLEATLREREEQCQSAQLAYDSALTQDPQDLKDLDKKKKNLAAAKLLLHKAKSDYQSQKMLFEKALERKISDFFIDEGVMETIPQANYITGSKISDSLVSELEDLQETFSEETKTLQTQVADYNAKLTKLNADKDALDKLLSDKKTLDIDARNLIAKTLQDIATNIKKLEAIRSEKINIKNSDDAVSLRGSIPSEQKEQDELLQKIIEAFDLLEKTKGKEAGMSLDILAKTEERKKLLTEIDLAKAQHDIYSDQYDEVSRDLKINAQHLGQLKTLMENDKEGEYYYYEAADATGDFTDNYGEPLIEGPSGTKYCALILSMILDDQPEAAKLFHGKMSGFSSPVLYTSR